MCDLENMPSNDHDITNLWLRFDKEFMAYVMGVPPKPDTPNKKIISRSRY